MIRAILNWILKPLDTRIRRIADEVRVKAERREMKSRRIYT